MGRKYETVNLSDYEFKKNYKKARENMRKKKKEALKIIRKSNIVDLEIKILCALMVMIVLMFAVSPFIIMRNSKKNINGANVVKNKTLNVQTENDIKTQTIENNNSGIRKIINEAGNILGDINHTEIFN